MTMEIPLVEYDSAARGASPLADVVELVRYRDLLGMMVANMIKTRYKRSALGVIWTLLNPLLNMVVLTIAFSTLFQVTVKDYAVFVLSGLIAWNFFTSTTLFAMSSLVWGSSLLKRIYMPRTIFSVAAVGNGLVNMALSIIPLVLISVATGHPIYQTWMFLPFAVVLLAMFSLGVALFLSTLAVFFTDTVDIYQVAVQAAFFMTPIMYPKEILPARFLWLIKLNPMYHLIEMFRVPIVVGSLPGPHTMLAAAVSAVVALLVGWWVFNRKAEEFAYRI
jgi:ABC-2 type transport system permease protein